MIKGIVDGINETLRSLDAVCYGISTPTFTADAEGKVSVIPVEIDHFGDCRYPDPEDQNRLTFYHRLIRKGYAKQKGYGDGNGLQVTYEMKLMCFGMRRKVRSSVEDIEQLVVSLFPESVGRGKVDVVSSDFDQNRLFSEEFVNVESFMSPDLFLFSTAYKVSVTYNSKRCLNKQ